MDTVNRVWTGKAGLARTYGLFGGLVGFFFWFVLGTVTPGIVEAVAVSAALGAFLVWVNTGIWRSASKYEGPAIWSGLAKFAAVLGFMFAAAAIAGVMMAVLSDSPISSASSPKPRYYTDAEVGFPAKR